MRRLPQAAVLLALVACAAAGCDDGSADPEPPAGLPAIGGDCLAIDCFEPGAAAPTLPAWLGGAEVVVLGDVVAVEPLLEPAQVAVTNGPIRTEESCAGPIEGGIVVVLRRLDALSGELGEAELRIKFGHDTTDVWCPAPYVTRAGITWSGDRRIGVGQRLGLRLYRDPDWNELTPLGGLLFFVGKDGRLHFQEDTSRCSPPPPPGLDGATPEQGRAMLGAVDRADPAFEEAAAGIAQLFANYDADTRRISLYGATCFERVEEPSGCVVDADCSVETVCVAGACTPY